MLPQEACCSVLFLCQEADPDGEGRILVLLKSHYESLTLHQEEKQLVTCHPLCQPLLYLKTEFPLAAVSPACPLFRSCYRFL